jgi:hypothetical protein
VIKDYEEFYKNALERSKEISDKEICGMLLKLAGGESLETDPELKKAWEKLRGVEMTEDDDSNSSMFTVTIVDANGSERSTECTRIDASKVSAEVELEGGERKFLSLINAKEIRIKLR